jgi:hypothetical protein
MGEAKKRGTYEQRRSAAIKRDKAAAEPKRNVQVEERETHLLQTITTPEERQRQFHAKVFISTLQEIAAKTARDNKRQHLTTIDGNTEEKTK